MKKIIFILTIVSISLFSCKKNDVEPNREFTYKSGSLPISKVILDENFSESNSSFTAVFYYNNSSQKVAVFTHQTNNKWTVKVNSNNYDVEVITLLANIVFVKIDDTCFVPKQ